MLNHDPFNDGYMEFGKRQTKFSSTMKNIGSEFVSQGHFAYSEMSAREQDYSMVDSLGGTLDLKLKTMYPPHFENLQHSDLTSLLVKAKETLFEVVKVDKDRHKGNLFWYLQKVGEVQ